jgi:hypothetical protein
LLLADRVGVENLCAVVSGFEKNQNSENQIKVLLLDPRLTSSQLGERLHEAFKNVFTDNEIKNNVISLCFFNKLSFSSNPPNQTPFGINAGVMVAERSGPGFSEITPDSLKKILKHLEGYWDSRDGLIENGFYEDEEDFRKRGLGKVSWRTFSDRPTKLSKVESFINRGGMRRPPFFFGCMISVLSICVVCKCYKPLKARLKKLVTRLRKGSPKGSPKKPVEKSDTEKPTPEKRSKL